MFGICNEEMASKVTDDRTFVNVEGSMDNWIIGTAGHIDHGKTELIRALTGRNTDTLKEERERGISIDLGFTYFELPDGVRAGIIDVPGHEKFLPNMLAGVCGIDMVLLVIALDEGIQPQTLEHIEILSQLEVHKGIVVLTKQDCVELEWAELMEEEIGKRLQKTVCESWPRIQVSSKTKEGIASLKALIVKQLCRGEKERNQKAAFRMPIDRVFSLEGRGTVIAGTILEGSICKEENVELYPAGTAVRIREIQSYGTSVSIARAGQRAALLVAGIKKENVVRGDVAAAEGSLQLSERLDVKVRMAKDTKRTVKNRMRVHLHIGTCQCVCRVVLFGCEELKAGEQGYAQLLLEKPLAVKKQDLFILRFYSPLETIGGGVVLDECAPKHKRSDVRVPVRLAQLEGGKCEQLLVDTLKASGEQLLCVEELARETGLDENWITEQLAEGKITGVHILKGKKTVYGALEQSLDFWKQKSMEWMEGYRKKHPYQSEIFKAVYKKDVFPKWDKEAFEVLFQYCAEQGLFLERTGSGGGGTFVCPSCPVYRDRQFLEIQKLLVRKLEKARFQFLRMEELRPESMSEISYRELVKTLEYEGCIVHISEDYYTTAALVEAAVEQVELYFQENEILTYTVLRDMLETTRRSVRTLIAYLDERKITLSCGKETERRRFGEENEKAKG